MMAEKQKKLSINDYADKLSDAITASGKKLKDIEENSIRSFLSSLGANERDFSEILSKLTGGSKKTQVGNNSSVKVVDYTDTSHNDVKVRTPRKSVFSEIIRLS